MHFHDGFEAFDLANRYSAASIGNNQQTNASLTRYGVGNALYFNFGGNLTYPPTPWTPGSNRIYCGFAAQRINFNNSDSQFFLQFKLAGVEKMTVTWVGNTMFFKRGATTIHSVAVTSLTGWVAYEFEFKFDTASTGRIVAKINNVEVANFTGVTMDSGTTVDQVVLGGGSIQAYWDDFWLDDTASMGPCRIITTTPNAAGSSTQFTPSAGANYTTVDELPVSSSDYNTGVPGQKDLYNVGDIPADVGTIKAVQVGAVVQKMDAVPVSGRVVVKSGATNVNGTTQSLTDNLASYREVFLTDPNTSNPWTIAGVNAMEIGYEVI